MTDKICPRCGAQFVCRHETPHLCQCAGVVLTSSQREALARDYADCLCRACLLEYSRK